MRLEQIKNQFTWIVQAEQKDHNGDLWPIPAFYFDDIEEAIIFFREYVKELENDLTIHCCTLSSQYSVTTAIPYVAFWIRRE